MSTKKKRQHFVPKSYLNKFCDDNKRIWAFDKDRLISFPTKPRDIAQERYFNDFPIKKDKETQTIENLFANKIEPIQNKSIKTILEKVYFYKSHYSSFPVVLNHKLKVELAYTMSFQWLRTKEHRKFISDFFKATKSNLREEAKKIYNETKELIFKQIPDTTKYTELRNFI